MSSNMHTLDLHYIEDSEAWVGVGWEGPAGSDELAVGTAILSFDRLQPGRITHAIIPLDTGTIGSPFVSTLLPGLWQVDGGEGGEDGEVRPVKVAPRMGRASARLASLLNDLADVANDEQRVLAAFELCAAVEVFRAEDPDDLFAGVISTRIREEYGIASTASCADIEHRLLGPATAAFRRAASGLASEILYTVGRLHPAAPNLDTLMRAGWGRGNREPSPQDDAPRSDVHLPVGYPPLFESLDRTEDMRSTTPPGQRLLQRPPGDWYAAVVAGAPVRYYFLSRGAAAADAQLDELRRSLEVDVRPCRVRTDSDEEGGWREAAAAGQVALRAEVVGGGQALDDLDEPSVSHLWHDCARRWLRSGHVTQALVALGRAISTAPSELHQDVLRAHLAMLGPSPTPTADDTMPDPTFRRWMSVGDHAEGAECDEDAPVTEHPSTPSSSGPKLRRPKRGTLQGDQAEALGLSVE